MTPLAIAWFILIAVLFAAYAILDGFDLGVGFWSLVAKDEEERGAQIAAIGPFWDGNEVWLLAGGGAIFAAFPNAYAAIFSGFYLAFIAAIVAFILRAASVEFYRKHDARAWRRGWGAAFGIGSAVLPLIFGVAAGNILRGIPLDAAMNPVGDVRGLLNPFAIFFGITVLALFATHGAAFLSLRMQGEVAERARRRAMTGGLLCAALLIIAFWGMAAVRPELLRNYRVHPILSLLPVAAVLAALAVSPLCGRGRCLGALLAQALCLAAALASVAVALYPAIVPALGAPAADLTIANAASSPLTLKVMLVIAAVGMPLIVGYHVWMYRLFWKGRRGDAVS